MYHTFNNSLCFLAGSSVLFPSQGVFISPLLHTSNAVTAPMPIVVAQLPVLGKVAHGPPRALEYIHSTVHTTPLYKWRPRTIHIDTFSMTPSSNLTYSPIITSHFIR